jgi:selenocysteine-specific elongation factor
MRVIGTAGHVDHGKSTLVKALTGMNPDRLREEQEREMTIDLGFAWLSLPTESHPEGEEIGIVDVPGHRDFIENMLAGIGGIDAVLFVVAADEGVMPQTREHLAILDILKIPGGVVALTKIDMLSDIKAERDEWLDLVEFDLHEVFTNTVLENAPIVRVSPVTGEGIANLKKMLSHCLSERSPRPDLGKPRLSVDRVFTIAGFGSVVTGTLLDGSFQIGDEIEILPNGLHGRIRGLQSHKKKEKIAIPGSRTAVNISGISIDQIQRGDIVTHSGDYHPTRRLDAHFRLLPDASRSLKHNLEVKFFIGASETMARLRLLGTEELKPGEEGWIQIEPYQKVVAARNDRYILRFPSPSETLGGGRIIDPHPDKRHKRFSEETIKRLEMLSQGSPSEVLLQNLYTSKIITFGELRKISNQCEDDYREASRELLTSSRMINLSSDSIDNIPSENDLVLSHSLWEKITEQSIRIINDYHRKYPLRQGIQKEEFRNKLKTITSSSQKVFNAVINKLLQEQKIQETDLVLFAPTHKVEFSQQQKIQIDQLLQNFSDKPYTPPTYKECLNYVDEEILKALVEKNILIAVSPDVLFRKEDYDNILEKIQKIGVNQQQFTVAQIRDELQTSRRYVLAILEHFDAIGITIRDGDVRKLR